MNMDGDTGDRASAIRSEIRVSLLDEWRFRVKQAWAEIDTLQAENARLRGDLDTALGLRRMESRRVDTVRDHAEALAAALTRENLEAAGFECYPNVCKRCGHKGGEHDIYDKCLACSSCQTFASMDENERWEYALAALRAYLEGGCPGCSFQRQTGGNHDDVPTGDADPNCAFREAPNGTE